MRVLVIGANGQIGRHVVRMLGLSPEHEVNAMIRKEEQRKDMEELGADHITIGDLEQDFSHAYNGMDAVIFTAGSGGHTSKEQTEVIDRKAAQQAVDEARKSDVTRFVMISSIMADEAESAPDNIKHYMQAKLAADEHLIESGLVYTIIRPGPLTNDAARGTIHAVKKLDNYDGSVPREDVAATAVNSLTLKETENVIFEMMTGDVPVGEALKNLK
ncbi:SDR family oxidoreductase [Alkalicoccus luteus]|uniref:SDR family oxidoreductase n=1 Tax=Alkalicoccus luteus TaxID=1237094 RepID=A0A969PQP7_9BACI|nr:SDR family oxidoreductase [Alkalicoccus luteus]NJP36676.1 SDR family oxidoreductase [Alkalicoccus luteus]